jgi:hypothetical protein
MDIFAFLEDFNRQLDAKRRESFIGYTYELRSLVEPVTLLDELLLTDEDLNVVEEARLGELELLADDQEFDWPFGLLEELQDLELVPDGLPVSGVVPVGGRLLGLAADGTTD